jgi:hypothetical protein
MMWNAQRFLAIYGLGRIPIPVDTNLNALYSKLSSFQCSELGPHAGFVSSHDASDHASETRVRYSVGSLLQVSFLLLIP